MKDNYLLEIKGVNKFYKLGNKTDFQALNDINVKFKRGELVSIIGESGSGKSTLMNLIGGLDSDFEGEIIADGLSLGKLKDKDLDKYRKNKVGFVFQSFNLIPHLSILDNVTIALTLSNEKESVKVEKATKLLSRLGLEKQLKKKPNQLSGGQKQRVAIARALINEPEIILADEPTGALDSGTTSQILEILKEIADEGKLVIMVTHSGKVASISSRVVEILDGRIVRDEKRKGYRKGKVTAKPEKVIQSTKQNLTLWSALRLSLHNMWASKTKNLLMAFGVSISILSMILMLAFGSGLTDYIGNLASSYSSPDIVTITRRNQLPPEARQMSGMLDLLAPPSFESIDDVNKLVDDINVELEKGGYTFRADNTSENKNVSYGFNMGASVLGAMGAMAPSGIAIPKVEAAWTVKDETEEYKNNTGTIYYLYTTPAYYTSEQMISENKESHLSGDGEVMFSKGFANTLGIEPEECVGKTVSIFVSFNGVQLQEDVKVSAIVNAEMFEDQSIMYIDYTYFEKLVNQAAIDAESDYRLLPTTIYIKTDGERTANFIKDYRDKRGDEFQGALEEELAGMFSEMLSTFSVALAIIAGISLVVAAIMILVVLYMSVTERTREIGVLKSIGARRKDIKRIFSSESFLIGLLSGIVGIILSLIVGAIIIIILNATLGMAPMSFRWWYFVGALGISILISVLSGLYPAAKAAKLDPVESLRHE